MTDETRRLSELFDANILDTPAEPAFDHITRLASRLFRTPIALVSLVDDERQWFKARVGLDCSEYPREHAFCAHAIQHDAVFVVPDARADPRFAENPLVTGEPHIRFYAGAQLRASLGPKLGTLCIIDSEPRHAFGSEQQALLRDLANLVEDQLRRSSQGYVADRPPQTGASSRDDQVINACPSALVRVDGAGCVRTWNRAAERLFGWSAATLRDALLPFYTGPAGDFWSGLHRSAAAGETVTHARTHAADADGAVHTLRVAATPFPDGRDVGACLFTIDPEPLTIGAEPTDTEMVPGAAAHQLRAFVETTQDAVITGDSSGRVTSWNRGAGLIFGYRTAEALGRPLSDLMPERYRAAHEAGMARVIRSGHSQLAGQKLELTALHREGTEFSVELTLTAWSEHGSMQFGAVIRDITTRHRAEERHIAAMEKLQTEKERADAANAAKTRFLSNVSYELRTPLNAVIGFAEILADPQLRSVASQQYETYGQDILDSARHLLTVITDLIDLSKAEAGVSELHPESISATGILNRVERILHDSAQRAGQTLTLDLDETAPRVHADETKLRRILTNLAVNAAKHTPVSGTITLSAHAQGDTVVLAVSDTGAGMPPEDVPKALEPFGQLGGQHQRTREGTGLGLPLAKQLAETMGGTLTIDSTPGAGTRVRVTLPAAGAG